MVSIPHIHHKFKIVAKSEAQILGKFLAIGVVAGTRDSWNDHTNPLFFRLSTFLQENRRHGRKGGQRTKRG